MEYEAYLKRYPMSEDTPRAQYRLGMSIFRQFLDLKPELHLLDQFDKIELELSMYEKYRDKDLTLLKEASEAFADLVLLYPDSIYHDISRSYLQISAHIFSLQDLYVAKFYLRQKEYISAYRRLDHILYSSPETINTDEVKYQIGICLWNLKFKEESKKILDQLHNDTLNYKLKKKIARSLKKFRK